MPRSTKKKVIKPNRSETTIQDKPSMFEVVVIVASLVLLVLLLYTIESLITPFLIFGAIVFLLYPLKNINVAKNIMVLSTILFTMWFLHTIRGILSPFIISLFLAYLLHPVVTKVEKIGVPRWPCWRRCPCWP